MRTYEQVAEDFFKLTGVRISKARVWQHRPPKDPRRLAGGDEPLTPCPFRPGDRVRPSPYALTQCAAWLRPKMSERRGTVSPVGQKRGSRRVYVVWDGTIKAQLTYPDWLEPVPDEFGIEPPTSG